MTVQCSTLHAELQQSRKQTDDFFALIRPEFLYTRPIPERHRLIFYLGHLEAFDWNQLCRWTLGLSSFHPSFDQLFEAGIDPLVGTASSDSPSDWPAIGEVQIYNQRVREKIDEVLHEIPEEMIHVAIEHRLMHLETVAYLLQQLPTAAKYVPASTSLIFTGQDPSDVMHEIPAGLANLTQSREEEFGWDNERGEERIVVPVFRMNQYKITNGQYLRFVQAGGPTPPFWISCDRGWLLKTMFYDVPLPLSWPVYVTKQQAEAYADWKGLSLPTEAQFYRAAYGTSSGDDQRFPWGSDDSDNYHGNFNCQQWDPIPVTHTPQSANLFGLEQLIGNGWEWTSTPFYPFQSFQPLATYPGYSSRFFDNDHFVVKGGGPFTAKRLLRRTFRNWFRQDYPYAHTGFRCVKN